jgi:hypothetical protein
MVQRSTAANTEGKPEVRKPKQRPDPRPPFARDPLDGRLVVRLKEAFALIGCGHSKGYELIAAGRLKVVRIDRMTLVRVDSIRALLELPAVPDQGLALMVEEIDLPAQDLFYH